MAGGSENYNTWGLGSMEWRVGRRMWSAMKRRDIEGGQSSFLTSGGLD